MPKYTIVFLIECIFKPTATKLLKQFILFTKRILMMFCIIPVTFIPTRQGGRLLMVEGFTFQRISPASVSDASIIRWRCSSYLMRRCPATAQTLKDALVMRKSDHTHEPPTFRRCSNGKYIKIC